MPGEIDDGGGAESSDGLSSAPGPSGVPVGDDVAWDPWSPARVVDEMGPTAIPWCVTAGWAIDLFVGEQTRAHEDIEIAIPRARWTDLRSQLVTLEFVVAGSGSLFPLDSPAFDEHFQTWGRDSRGVVRLDVFRDPHEGATWICRRDHRLRLPYSSLISFTPDGVPFMVPEVVLLFKAKHDREKDRHDLAIAAASMAPTSVAWLTDAIQMVHPGHSWLALLGDLATEPGI